MRARSCPISGGSAASCEQPLRLSVVRACSCPITGDTTSCEQLLRSSSVRPQLPDLGR